MPGQCPVRTGELKSCQSLNTNTKNAPGRKAISNFLCPNRPPKNRVTTYDAATGFHPASNLPAPRKLPLQLPAESARSLRITIVRPHAEQGKFGPFH
jgi:hypothetical protein